MEIGLKDNIILIGFMGAGKTSVGKLLSGRLSYQFYDTDQLLEEKAKDSISHIFQVYGEEYFRNLETELLQELQPHLKHCVLSTGGGLPLREENANLLRELGHVVFLQASRQTILQRLRGDTTRPLLKGDDPEQKVDGLLKIRTPLYIRAAHQIIETDDLKFDEIVGQIMTTYSHS